jgi:hypothetical protein
MSNLLHQLPDADLSWTAWPGPSSTGFAIRNRQPATWRRTTWGCRSISGAYLHIGSAR